MRAEEPTIPVTLDGRETLAFEGETVLDLARREAVHIPTLCFLEGLSRYASCRLCLVSIAETPGLRPACATVIAEDMEVWTQTEEIRRYRRMIVELLFAEGNHICAVCVSNGACELQALAAELGVDHIRYDYVAPERDIDATHHKYVLDPNRCVLCTRCVRTCDEIEGAHVWDVADRGHRARIIAGMNQPWGTSAACTWCGKCVTACPTGALFFKGRAVGEMENDPGLVAFLTTARQEGVWLDRDGRR
ncbi:MAG: bidirectional hydrogenase complex protein HoxU [Acidimicrobiia bacterium]